MWTNRRMDRHTDEKRTNERTEFHQYRKEPSYHVDSNSNSTFIALNLYLMIDSKTQKAKIRDRNR